VSRRTSIGLEPFIAVECGSEERQSSPEAIEWEGLLERYAVLGNVLVARLPYEGDIAGIGCLEPPR
jgi:hypothetical protein